MSRGRSSVLDKRSVVLPISHEELEDFLEYLEKRMEGRDYSCKYLAGSSLKITLIGTKEENRAAESIVRRSYRNFKMIRNPVGDLYRYPSEWLMEHGGGVSMSLLTLSLKGAGLTATWKKDLLYTELEPEEIIDLMSELRVLVDEIKYEVRQRKAREVIVAVAVNSGVSPLDALDLAEEEGLMERDERGMWWFRADPELVMDTLIKKFSEMEVD
ncbi:MAG: hypothetical protein DRN78_03380 [Thermoproteota archaeon]|nr:MAG: hypothetical protein DRN78_03380 [Candidatus Korarchaeota archaeon]